MYSPAPRQVREWCIDVPDGARAALALESSGIFEAFPQLHGQSLLLGVWGQPVDEQHILQPGDRLEVYRRLLVEPKLSRRERFRRQGSKGAGLFSGVRAGGKAGY
ncbi:MAG: RnfH family protein [Polaromonas sp.]|nr:MAG: RnfH family protein [Polaromonas sp.]